MPKEKTIFIDLTKRNFNYFNNNLFAKIVNDFLDEHQEIEIDELIKNEDDLSKVYLEVLSNNKEHVKNPYLMYKTLEKIYDYWRNIKRYVLFDLKKGPFINKNNFLNQFDSLNEFLLGAYRTICTNLNGKAFTIYRQLPAFANAFILLDRAKTNPYTNLSEARYISRLAFRTPFVSYSMSNKRTGVFPIIDQNPMDGFKINKKLFCFPILVGQDKINVYFTERYMSLGLSLANLFEHNKDFSNCKPDGIILFGSNTIDGIYYDKEKDMYIGSLTESDEIDYFGYLKKIILTVHNIKMINNNKLPIHGAGVSITFKDKTTKNVVLIGDSGAGKSETLEALREIANDDIVDILTIYDDMGTFELNEKVNTYGTEIGAFVRTDDLAHDYVYQVFDRAIFLNPNGHNARLVLPVSSYQDVVKKYPVDLVLYANNYEISDKKIKIYNNKDEALKVFKEGKRIALGTTSESGFVSTFFANPFGPVQLKEKTEMLLNNYFEKLFNDHILIGELFTGLSLDKENPKLAAQELLKLLKEI